MCKYIHGKLICFCLCTHIQSIIFVSERNKKKEKKNKQRIGNIFIYILSSKFALTFSTSLHCCSSPLAPWGRPPHSTITIWPSLRMCSLVRFHASLLSLLYDVTVSVRAILCNHPASQYFINSLAFDFVPCPFGTHAIPTEERYYRISKTGLFYSATWQWLYSDCKKDRCCWNR